MWNTLPRGVLPTSLCSSSSTSQISDSALNPKRLKLVTTVSAPSCAASSSLGLKNELFVPDDGRSEAHSLCIPPTRDGNNIARRVTSNSVPSTLDTMRSCELSRSHLQISLCEKNEPPFLSTSMEKKSRTEANRSALPSVPPSDCSHPHLSDREHMNSPRHSHATETTPSDNDDQEKNRDRVPALRKEREEVEQKKVLRRSGRPSTVDEKDSCSNAQSCSEDVRNRDMYYVTSPSSFAFPSSRLSSGIAPCRHPLKRTSSPPCVLSSSSPSSPLASSVSVENVATPCGQGDHYRPSSAPSPLPNGLRRDDPPPPSPFPPPPSPAAPTPPDDTRIPSHRTSSPLPSPLVSNDGLPQRRRHHCWMSSRAFSRAALRRIEEREGIKKKTASCGETELHGGNHAGTSSFCCLSSHTEKSSPQLQDVLHALVSGVWCRLGLFQAFPIEERMAMPHGSGLHASPLCFSKDEKWDCRERDRKEGEGVFRRSPLPHHTRHCRNTQGEEENEAEKEREVARADMMCRWLTEYLSPAAAVCDQDRLGNGIRTGKGQKNREEESQPQRNRAFSLPLLRFQYPYFTRALWHLLWNTVQYCVRLHVLLERSHATRPPLSMRGTDNDLSFLSSITAEWTPCRLRYERSGDAAFPTEASKNPYEGERRSEPSTSDAVSSATAPTRAGSPIASEWLASESAGPSQWTRRRTAFDGGRTVVRRKWMKKNDIVSASQKESGGSGERNRSLHVFYDLEDLCEESYGKSTTRVMKKEEEEAKREWTRTGVRSKEQEKAEREEDNEGNRLFASSTSLPNASFIPPIRLCQGALRSHGHSCSGLVMEPAPIASPSVFSSPSCRTACVLTTCMWSHLFRSLALLRYPRAVFYTQTLHHCSPSELLLALLWCTREYHFVELVEQVVLHEQFPFMLSKHLQKKDSLPYVSPFPFGASYFFNRNTNAHEKKQQLEELLPSTMNWPPLNFHFAAMWRYRKKQLLPWNTVHWTSFPHHGREKRVVPQQDGEKNHSSSRRSNSCGSGSCVALPSVPTTAEDDMPHGSGTSVAPLSTPVARSMPAHTRGLLGLQKLFFSSLHRLEHALFERAQVLHVLGQEITHTVAVPVGADSVVANPNGASTETVSLPASPLDLLLCTLAGSDEDSEADEEEMGIQKGDLLRNPAAVSTGGGADREGREGSVDPYATTPSLYSLYMAGLYYMATLPARVARRRMHLRLLGSVVRASLVTGVIEDELEEQCIRAYASELENRGPRSSRNAAGTSIPHHQYPSSLSTCRFQHSPEESADSKTPLPFLFFLHRSPYTFRAMKPLYVPQVASHHSGAIFHVSRTNVLASSTTPTVGETTSHVRCLTKGEETMHRPGQLLTIHERIHREETVPSLYGSGTEKTKTAKGKEEERDALRSSFSSSLPLPSAVGFCSSSSSPSSFSLPSSSFCYWHIPSRNRIMQSVREDRLMKQDLGVKKALNTQKAVWADAKRECDRDVLLTSLRHCFGATHCCDVLANAWRIAVRQTLLQSPQKNTSSGVFSNTVTATLGGRGGVPLALHSSSSFCFLKHDIFVSRNMRDHYSLHSTLLAALFEHCEQATRTPIVASPPGLSCSFVSPVQPQNEHKMDEADMATPLPTADTSGNGLPAGSTSTGMGRDFFWFPNVYSWLSIEKHVEKVSAIEREKKTVEVLCHQNTLTFPCRRCCGNESSEGMAQEHASWNDLAGGVRRLSPCLVEGSGTSWMEDQSSSSSLLKFGKKDERDRKTTYTHHPCISSALLELQRVQDLVTVIQLISTEHRKSATTLHRDEEKWDDKLLAHKRNETGILWESLEVKSRAKEDRGAAAFAQLQRLYGLHPVTTSGFSTEANSAGDTKRRREAGG